MSKISSDFIIRQYQSGVETYKQFTTEVGLWDSERYVFSKYLQTEDNILDVGCGTGRTTFALFQMGYQKIEGVDLTPEMIAEAQQLNRHFSTQIKFSVGDARRLKFPDSVFDVVIFSFNGFMSIPGAQNRAKALLEINRVLKPGGRFLFTTHDREKDENYFEFWKVERKKWDAGEQSRDLFEFGDIITTSKNESREIFIHIPNRSEVRTLFERSGFELIETFYRSDLFNEPEAVKEKSGECRFWIVKKKGAPYSFRKLLSSDLDFLKEMFYESLYAPENEAPFPLSIIEKPSLAKYYNDWGKDEDVGILAENDFEEIGAVWSRFFRTENRGYGFVDEQTPELGIALRENYRNQGIGEKLLLRMFEVLTERGVKQVSLSVDLRNRAVNLYRKCGFTEYKTEGFSCIMFVS